MKNILSLPLVLLVLMWTQVATAADQKPPTMAPSPSSKGAIQKNLTDPNSQPPAYTDLPEKFIKEAHAFYDQCANEGGLNTHYNCKCLATKYLDKRIELGPKEQESIILMNIVRSSDCADASVIAGFEYEGCKMRGALMPPNISVEDYCSCYASTYARLFEQSGVEPGTLNELNLKSQAYVTCENPVLGKQLYQNQAR